MYQYQQQQQQPHYAGSSGQPAYAATNGYPPAAQQGYGGYPPSTSYGPPAAQTQPVQQYLQSPPPQQHQQYQQQQPYYGNGVGPSSSSPPPPAPSYAYGAPAATPQPASYYAAPSPAPQPYIAQPNIGADPNAFGAHYSQLLRRLTVNSKPQINELTILAQDHKDRMSHIVAQCLEDHIRQVPSNMKLPALYTLDSICKNVAQPYTDLFARTIDRIFLTAYHEVDPSTKSKLQELLGTWRYAGENGTEVFKLPPGSPYGARPPQRVMEDVVYQGHPPPVQHTRPPTEFMPGNTPVPQHLLPHVQQSQFRPSPVPQAQPPPPMQPTYQSSPPIPGPSAAEKAAVLYDLRKLLSIRREQAALNPADRSNHEQIATLTQLEHLVVTTNLGSSNLAQIRDQLARLTPHQAARNGTPPVATGYPQAQGQTSEYERSAKRQRLISPPPPNRGTPPPPASLAALTSLLNPDLIRSASAQGARSTATPPPSVAPIPLPPFMQQHLAQQQQPPPLVAPIPTSPKAELSMDKVMAGLDPSRLSALPGPVLPIPISAEEAQNKAANEQALAAYEHHRAHYTVRLQNSDVARYRPGAHALLYEALPLKCKQCGNRYLDCPLGKDRLGKDLDRHLRISRRYNEGVGAQSKVNRSWMVPEEEWVLPAHAVQPSEAVMKTEQAKKEAAATAEILNKSVAVPPDAATNEEKRHCPICKEEFKNEYSEEEEDWIWRNAVAIDGTIYHASCKAEQETS